MDMIPSDSQAAKDKRALEKHSTAVAQVWADFPAFPKLIKKVDSMLDQYAGRHNVNVNTMQFGEMLWHPDGWVTAEIYAGKVELIDMSGKKKELARVMFMIGHQLVGMTERRKSSCRLVKFVGLKIEGEKLMFKVMYANKPLGPQKVNLT